MHNDQPIRVGLFFGGPSREREISFAGGRTLYDHLDRKYFQPIPIFIDSLGNFILLHWSYLYQGTIREFYPPATPKTQWEGIPLYIESLTNASAQEREAWIQAVGKKIEPVDFLVYFDIAFLCLHGPYGEDGAIQGLLQWYHIPYTGSGLLAAALGMDKLFQRKLLKDGGFALPRSLTLSRKQWIDTDARDQLFDQIIAQLGLPFVVKTSRQGSSIGVTIVADFTSFTIAVNKAFFIEEVCYAVWKNYTQTEKKDWIQKLIDPRTAIGFPLMIEERIFYRPATLLHYIEERCKKEIIRLISTESDREILIEAWITGREFSCVVIEGEKGKPIALPPTEMLKGALHFDYRAKYLPGIVHKQTPMRLSPHLGDAIRKKVIALFQLLNARVYARIDGFLTDDNEIIVNDPNTTVGIQPSSFLFHQAAEIGLTPTQLLTFLVKRSLEVRVEEGYFTAIPLLNRLEVALCNGKPAIQNLPLWQV